MPAHFVYRTYRIALDGDSARSRIDSFLLENGFVKDGGAGGIFLYRYPSLRFSSKRPLTCISRLSLDVDGRGGGAAVKIGVTFTKIKYFNVFMMTLLCVVLPTVLGIVQHGTPDMPPMSFVGIPLGVGVHYHVRGRVFRVLERIVRYIESEGTRG